MRNPGKGLFIHFKTHIDYPASIHELSMKGIALNETVVIFYSLPTFVILDGCNFGKVNIMGDEE